MMNKPKSLLLELDERGLEFDQRMYSALELVCNEYVIDSLNFCPIIYDHQLFLALIRQDSILTRLIPYDIGVNLRKIEEEYYLTGLKESDISPNEVALSPTHQKVFETMFKQLNTKTISVQDYLRAIINVSRRYHFEGERGYTSGLIAWACNELMNVQLSISKTPRTLQIFDLLENVVGNDNDYQYILAAENSQIVFRVVSVLNDYVHKTSSGSLAPQRAHLTHFKDKFGGFTPDEICELEDLINSKWAKELDFQQFFERHPHFLRRWDYREVYSHVILSHPEYSLIPDFILTNRELQEAAILELKLPRAKLIRRQNNRKRFASAVIEARAQLLEYRNWFRNEGNRRSLVENLGMEIYEPSLVVVIGRASEFQDEFDRQSLRSDNPDISIVTYDDILRLS